MPHFRHIVTVEEALEELCDEQLCSGGDPVWYNFEYTTPISMLDRLRFSHIDLLMSRASRLFITCYRTGAGWKRASLLSMLKDRRKG